MKRLLLPLVILGAVLTAAEVPYTTVTKEEGVYTLELAGVGFVFGEELDQPQPFMIKILSRVQKLEAMETPTGEVPVTQKVLVEPLAIRVGYVTYPVDVLVLSTNYLEADVYSGRVEELGEVVAATRIGKLQLTLAYFAGLPGGKGSLKLGDETYSVVFYKNEALDGFYRWAPELE